MMIDLPRGIFPDFLCIGAQKAGTTWLHAILRRHPKIWLPDRKEIHYFDNKFPPYQPYPDKWESGEVGGLGAHQGGRLSRLRQYTPGRLAWECHYRLFPRTNAWYARLFSPAGNRVTGDFTPAYAMLDDQAVEQLKNMMPNLRIIFIMRNPIERAWSHARMILGRRGRRPVATIPEHEFITFLNGKPSRWRGRYTETIDRWTGCFSQAVFLPMFFDDIILDPRRFINDVLCFLDLGPMPPDMLAMVCEPVHKGQALDIPKGVYKKLHELYEPEIQALANRFNGAPQEWLARIQA